MHTLVCLGENRARIWSRCTTTNSMVKIMLCCAGGPVVEDAWYACFPPGSCNRAGVVMEIDDVIFN